MGCAKSKEVEVVNHVDLQLAEAAERERYHFKVLLLGAGESGKSTLGKQLKLITKGSLGDAEKSLCRKAIRQNLVECMRTLLDAGEALGIPLADSTLRKAVTRVRDVDIISGDVPPSVGQDVVKLWKDEGVQKTWEKKDKYWILDSTPYYMREAIRLTEEKFDPTDEDVVMTRVITTGVGTIEIGDPPFKYTVVDVGGQRNERKKWLHCFDDVKAIVFLVSLAGYNQVMFEDASQNRLLESLSLYEQVVSNPLFRNTPIHVLLNKTDLFEEMIREVPLTTCFPEYTGPPHEVHSAISFIEARCKSIMTSCCPHKKPPVVTPICARVRKDVKLGWKEITNTIRTTYNLEAKR
ncbi:unnamed protein product [Ascophyllum nodosum]